MGWTGRHKPSGVSAKDEIIKELTGDNESGRWTVLAIASKGGTYYAATEFIKKENGKLKPKTRIVFCAVVLTSYNKDYYNFYTKVMDDGMGPYACECPVKVLDLLTPTDNANALEWRETCRKNAAKPKPPKLAEGDVLKFKEPLSFGAYGSVNELTVFDVKKRHYRASFGLCRLRRDSLKNREYKIYRGKKLLMAVNG